jgi:hypothetical protein
MLRVTTAYKVVAAYLLVCVIGFACLLLYDQAEYPVAFNIQNLEKIKKGDSLDVVVRELGYPWSYIVPGNINLPRHCTNMAELPNYCSTNVYDVILEYSRPRWGESFNAREVLIRSNRVYSVRRYYYEND